MGFDDVESEVGHCEPILDYPTATGPKKMMTPLLKSSSDGDPSAETPRSGKRRKAKSKPKSDKPQTEDLSCLSLEEICTQLDEQISILDQVASSSHTIASLVAEIKKAAAYLKVGVAIVNNQNRDTNVDFINPRIHNLEGQLKTTKATMKELEDMNQKLQVEGSRKTEKGNKRKKNKKANPKTGGRKDIMASNLAPNHEQQKLSSPTLPEKDSVVSAKTQNIQ